MGMDKHRRAPTLAGLSHQNQRRVEVVGLYQCRGMPRDFVGCVLQEVIVCQSHPEPVCVLGGEPQLGASRTCGLTCLADQLLTVDGVLQAAPEGATCLSVQVLEQGALPRVPQVRIGAANIGAGQYEQVIQMRLVADAFCKLMDDTWVGNVFLLGGDG